MNINNAIDVTTIEPQMEYSTILKSFDSLMGGQSFTVCNDHDPQYLYHQLLEERGNGFNWEYIEQGPNNWKVEIVKHKLDETKSTIDELLIIDYRKAEVFNSFGLKFCSSGKKTLLQACTEQGVDLIQIEEELKAVDYSSLSLAEDYNSWDIFFLTDYIINIHHRYVRQAIPVIFEYTQQIGNTLIEVYPEINAIADNFLLITDEINRHVCKEEEILFPYIKHLAIANSNGMKIEASPFGTVKNPVDLMEHDHEMVVERMEKIKSLSYNYTPPSGANEVCKVLYGKLKEFEDDLYKHIHLESNILFPKVIELENKLK